MKEKSPARESREEAEEGTWKSWDTGGERAICITNSEAEIFQPSSRILMVRGENRELPQLVSSPRFLGDQAVSLSAVNSPPTPPHLPPAPPGRRLER